MLIKLIHTEWVRGIEAEIVAKGLGLRYMQFLILERLAMLGSMSATELARTVELDLGAMTRQLDQLEGRGYLRRHPHALDRRTLRIELTEHGHAVRQQLMGCSERVLEAAQRKLSDIEREHLHDCLVRVLRALRENNKN